MKTEFLQGFGLDKEAVGRIMAENGRDIEAAKAELSALRTRLEAAEASLGEANAALEAYRAFDIDGLKRAADDWEQKAREAEEKSEEAIRRLRLDAAIDAAVAGARAKNARAVRALLDEDALRLSDEGVEGLDAQLAALRRENGFLFEAAPARGGAGFSGMRPPGALSEENAGAFMNGLIKARGE